MSAFGVTVRMIGLPRLIHENPKQPEFVRQATLAAIDAAGLYIERALAKRTPRGASHPGAARQVTYEPPRMTGTGDLTGHVGYAEPASNYIGFVDQGTSAHFPPIAPLVLWAARKFNYPLSSAEARRAGYRVARSIARRGVKPQRFIAATYREDGPRALGAGKAAARSVLGRV